MKSRNAAQGVLHRVLLSLPALVITGCVGLYPPSLGTLDFNKYRYTCLGQTSAGGKKIEDTLQAECAVPSADIGSAIKCPKDTRDVFGGFLECREDEQLAFGTSIATLAAGAAGVAAAGISTIAAISLGGASGAGLGLDYILYNKPKTKAYADAVAQLQCVIGVSAPLKDRAGAVGQFELTDYTDALLDLRYYANNFPRYLKNQRYPAKKTAMEATAEANGAPPTFLNFLRMSVPTDQFVSAQNYCGDPYEINLVEAQYKLAKSRAQFASRRLNALRTDIPMTTETISVRAFAASQAGVPDAEQIQKGAQAASSFMPKAATTGKAEGIRCDEIVPNAQAAIANLDHALDGAEFPKSGFPECLALKAYEDSGASDSSKNSKSSNAKSGKDNGSSKDKTGSDSSSGNGKSSDSEPAQPPDKIAFQVLPSDEIPVDKDTSRATIRIVGGKPPYYVEAVDPGVKVIRASQTDVFVSFEIQRTAQGNAEPRVLCGDQAGSEEVVYISSPAPAKSSGATPKPKPKPKPGLGGTGGGAGHT